MSTLGSQTPGLGRDPCDFFFSFQLLQLASWNGFWSTDYLCAAFTWQLVRMEEAIKETLQNKHYFLSWVFFFLAAEPAAAVQTGWWMQTIWNNSFSLGSINTTFSLLMCVCVCHNTHTRGGGDFYFTALETDSYYRFNDFTFQSVPLDFSAVNVVKKKLSERGDRWPQWHKKKHPAKACLHDSCTDCWAEPELWGCCLLRLSRTQSFVHLSRWLTPALWWTDVGHVRLRS